MNQASKTPISCIASITWLGAIGLGCAGAVSDGLDTNGEVGGDVGGIVVLVDAADRQEWAARSPDEGGDDEADLGQMTQAIGTGAPQVVSSGDFSHIGPLFNETSEWDHDPGTGEFFGRECDEGYERDEPLVTATNGSCRFFGWLNPDNVHDCRIRIQTTTYFPWGGVSCQYTTFQQRSIEDTAQSCGRRGQHCGGSAPDGSCWCNPSCVYYGDCCADYEDVCL